MWETIKQYYFNSLILKSTFKKNLQIADNTLYKDCITRSLFE